jgi:hypothetical protein
MKHQHLFVLAIAAFTAFFYHADSGVASPVSNIAQNFLVLGDLKATHASAVIITGEPGIYLGNFINGSRNFTFNNRTFAPTGEMMMESDSIRNMFFNSRDDRNDRVFSSGFLFVKGNLVPIEFNGSGTSVPEPSTLFLFFLGLLGFAGLLRKEPVKLNHSRIFTATSIKFLTERT